MTSWDCQNFYELLSLPQATVSCTTLERGSGFAQGLAISFDKNNPEESEGRSPLRTKQVCFLSAVPRDKLKMGDLVGGEALPWTKGDHLWRSWVVGLSWWLGV